MKTLEQCVVVVAPVGRDAALTGEILAQSGIRARIAPDLIDVARRLGDGTGALLFTEEALLPAHTPVLLASIRAQPAWSDIPIIVMIGNGKADRAPGQSMRQLFGPHGNITLLERPVQFETLLAALHSALRARRRQYDMRDYLAERQQQEEQLRETQKLESIGVLAGGVAHDFNNLLTGILGNASLLLENALPGSFEYQALSEVVKGSERAAELTQNLLAYAGKGRFIIRPLDLSQMVQEIARLVQNLIPKTAELRIEAAAGLPPVEGDSGQLQQIVMNLIINAAEALEERRGGWVHVSTGLFESKAGNEDYLGKPVPPEPYICLTVRDNGTGMDAATRKRVFDPFFTTKFQGRGLGLAAVLGIVRGHRGYLQVESQPGAGTTFRVLLPPGRPPAREAPVSAAATPEAGGKAILVVDDEPSVRSVVQRALSAKGYRVVLAENGQMALDLFNTAPADIGLVLLDLTMPVMGGEETYAHIKRASPELPVILSSGFSGASLAERFAGKGFSGFLQKPFSAAQLVDKIAQCLAPLVR